MFGAPLLSAQSCPPRSLLRLGSEVGCIGLRTKIGGGAAGLGEEAGKYWLDEGSEYDLSTAGLGKSHPKDQDELKCVVEC